MAFTYVKNTGRGSTTQKFDPTTIRVNRGRMKLPNGSYRPMFYMSIGSDYLEMAGIKVGDSISIAVDENSNQMMIHLAQDGYGTTLCSATTNKGRPSTTAYGRITRKLIDGLPRWAGSHGGRLIKDVDIDVIRVSDLGSDAIIVNLPKGVQYSDDATRKINIVK